MSEPTETVAEGAPPGGLGIGSTPRRSVLARWARGLLRRRLGALAGGRLTVADPWGVWDVGERGTLEGEVEVLDPGFYLDLLRAGSLGAGESYLAGGWRSPDLVQVFRLILANESLGDALDRGPARLAGALARWRHARRANTRAGSRRNVAGHYDLGNDFFSLFLDPTLSYSAAIFEHPAASLEEASIAKLERVCQKLELTPADHLLEIGTGWGGLALHAASRYGCRVTTATISREQHALASRRVAQAGLEGRVSVLLRDYRDLEGRYDKLASIEMVEAVGHANLPGFFRTCARLLRRDGRMVLQSITMPDRRYAQYLASADFIRLHVFPGGSLPSLGALVEAAARASDLAVVHVEDIGPHYAETLRRWRQAFTARLDAVRALGYAERFLRLWHYYLCYCEAGFEDRYLADLQIVLDRPARRSAPLLGRLGAA